jgi:ribonuclease D
MSDRRQDVQEAVKWAQGEFPGWSPEVWVQVAALTLADNPDNTRKPKARRTTLAADDPLTAALKAWRAARAKADKRKLFHILHNRTVAALATERPHSADQLAAIAGLGPWKVKHYGADLLRIIAEHAATPARKGRELSQEQAAEINRTLEADKKTVITYLRTHRGADFEALLADLPEVEDLTAALIRLTEADKIRQDKAGRYRLVASKVGKD